MKEDTLTGTEGKVFSIKPGSSQSTDFFRLLTKGGSYAFHVDGAGNVMLGTNSSHPFLATENHHATSKKFTDDTYLQLTGGTLTGNLKIHASDDATDVLRNLEIRGVRPSNSNKAASSITFINNRKNHTVDNGYLQYFCNEISQGGKYFRMSEPLLLDKEGTEDTHAVTKKYVDNSSGKVPVIAGNLASPEIGNMWFNKNQNTLIMRIA